MRHDTSTDARAHPGLWTIQPTVHLSHITLP